MKPFRMSSRRSWRASFVALIAAGVATLLGGGAGGHARKAANGRNQALRIPREFELPGTEAILHKEGDRLIIEPVEPTSLLALLATLEPLDEEFPPIPKLPVDPVDL